VRFFFNNFDYSYRLTNNKNFKMKILAGMTAILGFLAVALGAFGAHALKNSIPLEMIGVWKTAVQYQMFHVLALLSIILLDQRDDRAQWQIIGWLFAIGCIIFSGSLYLLAISDIKIFGMITPIGGGTLLVGWLLLFFSLIKESKKK